MDIRWEQRFSNFVKAMDKLQQSVEYIFSHDFEKNSETVADELLKEGLIQRFEYTFELAGNVMKDYSEFQGTSLIGGSRDAIRQALQLGIIANGETWMDMLKSRNKTSHTYNEETANEIYDKILNEYFQEFQQFRITMESKRSGKQGQLL
jgi:nucleotidyltransferase substrate binding protein (TIGR01987 family)